MRLSALSALSAERRVAVKAGSKSVHFILDGCLLSCYFFGSMGKLSEHFVHKLERGRGTGISYMPCPLMKFVPFLRLSPRKHSPVFLPFETETQTNCITHYTLLRKAVLQNVFLWKPCQCVTVSSVPAGRKRGTISSPPIVPLLLFCCRISLADGSI